MDALGHQLLFDLIQALQQLGGAHEDTDTFLRFSIIRAFETIQSPELAAFVEQRWQEYLQHPERVSPWSQLKARILASSA